jgi:WD40 repeat protein
LGILVRIPSTVEVRSFTGHTGTVHTVSLSPDGKTAISGGADGTVRLWDTNTGTEKWKGEGHIGAVLSVAFSADGSQAISGGADKAVRLWEVATGTSRAFSVGMNADPGHGAAVWIVRFGDSKHARSVSSDKTIHWVIATGKPRQVPDGRRDLILGQKYKADIGPGDEVKPGTRIPSDSGEFLISGLGTTIATLWRRGATEKALPRSIGHSAALPSPAKLLAVSGDGARLLTVCDDNSIRLWEAIPTSTVARPAKAVAGFPWTPDYDLTCVALDADGKQALLGGPSGTLKLWRLP